MSSYGEQKMGEGNSGSYDPSSATTRGKEKEKEKEKEKNNEKGVNDSTNNSGSKNIDTAERARRKKIRSLFASLHAMLPHVPPQADKVKVVDETMSYIKTLEQTLKNLEKKKMERLQSSVSYVGNPSGTSRDTFKAKQEASSSSPTGPSTPHNNGNKPEKVIFQTWSSPNVVVNISGYEAQFNVCSSKNNRGLFTNIYCVLHKYKIEVLSAHISRDSIDRRFYMIQAKVINDSGGELSAKDTFKQAAAEMIQFTS